ncbi:hypothetical protein, partial [uncultured Alistipes sp.]|uniref:hypothetical protein n=1 Tax=uncultured Alistipes sp. TaxID=538949 RepID=UPI0032205358
PKILAPQQCSNKFGIAFGLFVSLSPKILRLVITKRCLLLRSTFRILGFAEDTCASAMLK